MKPLCLFRPVLLIPILLCWIPLAHAQTIIDSVWAVPPDGGFDTVRIQLPADYDPQHPPAILIWWHQLGARPWEMWEYTEFAAVANTRGWIAASSFGPHDRHWNTRRAQHYLEYLLTYLMANHPFDLDSIYMIGGSMGSAAGQVWHNNNCGEHDFFIAATAGASQILDTERRQFEFLDGNPADTNRSMRAAFGGIPCHPEICQSFDSTETPGEFRFAELPCAAPRCDSIAFEYHRYSAVYFADTSQSMHYNCARLPVYNTWGANVTEFERYGVPAQLYAAIRAPFPAPTLTFESSISGHGFQVMYTDQIADWLAQFSANRQPDTLALVADEDDEYYWMRAAVARPYEFGRWGAVRSVDERMLDLDLVRNIDTIGVDLTRFELQVAEHLQGVWRQHDEQIASTVVALYPLYEVASVTSDHGVPDYTYDRETARLYVTLNMGTVYDLLVDGVHVDPRPGRLAPDSPRLAQAYPNPFNSRVTLTIESPIAFFSSLEVYSILGQQAKSVPVRVGVGSSTVSFDTGELASGAYWVTLRGRPSTPLKIVLLK